MEAPPPDAAVLTEADRAFAQDVAERGVEGWLEHFAEDGAMLVPGTEVRGHAAIRERMAPAFADPGFIFTWEPTRAEIGTSGDIGYTVGRYRQELRGEGEPQVREGAYVTVWRRAPDGRWRVELDLGVPDSDE